LGGKGVGGGKGGKMTQTLYSYMNIIKERKKETIYDVLSIRNCN
jgi:hypothetical protein